MAASSVSRPVVDVTIPARCRRPLPRLTKTLQVVPHLASFQLGQFLFDSVSLSVAQEATYYYNLMLTHTHITSLSGGGRGEMQ